MAEASVEAVLNVDAVFVAVVVASAWFVCLVFAFATFEWDYIFNGDAAYLMVIITYTNTIICDILKFYII